MLTFNQDAYRTCIGVEKEEKMQSLVDLDKQINNAGITMNAKIDECNHIAGLMNAAGVALNAVIAQLI